jgi:hypothetical protein
MPVDSGRKSYRYRKIVFTVQKRRTRKGSNLRRFFKKGYRTVIELDDEVEYLIDEKAEEAVKRNDPLIALTRLFDHEILAIETKEVLRCLQKRGPTSFLRKP